MFELFNYYQLNSLWYFSKKINKKFKTNTHHKLQNYLWCYNTPSFQELIITKERRLERLSAFSSKMDLNWKKMMNNKLELTLPKLVNGDNVFPSSKFQLLQIAKVKCLRVQERQRGPPYNKQFPRFPSHARKLLNACLLLYFFIYKRKLKNWNSQFIYLL